MTKLISILGLGGLLLIGCSNKGNPLNEIIRNKRLEIEKYNEYIINAMDIPKSNTGLPPGTYIYFDFNKNKKIDALGVTRITGYVKGDKGIIAQTIPYVLLLAIDKDENGDFEMMYADKDEDGYLERIK